MTEPHQPEDDPGADTETFRAFAHGDEPRPPRPVGVPFRVFTLLVGIVVFVALVLLLLRL